MLVAQKQRKENIVEYMLYMWQVENLIRANGLDMQKIEDTIVKKYQTDSQEQYQEIYDWWDNLTEMMRLEKKEERGHLQVTQGLMNDVYNFHLYLLTQPEEAAYQNAFQTAWSDLSVLEKKIPKGDKLHHVELALTGIYDYIVLKLQGKTILADTTNAVMRISHFMALLSAKYLKAERDLHKELNTNNDGTLTDASLK
jgi:hypothetical protein